jgi:isoamylase
MTHTARPGNSFPLESTVYPSGVNFSVYSRSATGMQLALFNRADDAAHDRTIELNREKSRSGDHWHVFVPECRAEQIYGYRVDGPFDPQGGHRYDPSKVLLILTANAARLATTPAYRQASRVTTFRGV